MARVRVFTTPRTPTTDVHPALPAERCHRWRRYVPSVDRFEFTAGLWLYEGEAAWHFITVLQDMSDEVEVRTASQRRGFGSVRVRVTVGATTWSTSVFPDAKRQAYILPVRKEVRRAEDLSVADELSVALELLHG